MRKVFGKGSVHGTNSFFDLVINLVRRKEVLSDEALWPDFNMAA